MADDGDDEMIMHRFDGSASDPLELDEDTVDGLVSGSLGPDEIPSAYARAARLIESAAAPARADELRGEDEVVAMFVAEMASRRPIEAARGAKLRVPRRLPRAAAAAMLAGTVVIGGGLAAAAAGRLPDPVQRVAHDTLDHVGLSVPDGSDAPTPGEDLDGRDGRDGGDPAAPGGDEQGCSPERQIPCSSDATPGPDAPDPEGSTPGAGSSSPATPGTPATPGHPATPATPGTPAAPGGPGTPATPATPVTPPHPTPPTTPGHTSPTTPDHPSPTAPAVSAPGRPEDLPPKSNLPLS